MRIVVNLTIEELFAIEQNIGVASRAMDMARVVGCDLHGGDGCDTPVALVFLPRLGDGWVGYSSPWVRQMNRFDNLPHVIEQSGDKLDRRVVDVFVSRTLVDAQ